MGGEWIEGVETSSAGGKRGGDTGEKIAHIGLIKRGLDRPNVAFSHC